jgi:hypothetical protein
MVAPIGSCVQFRTDANADKGSAVGVGFFVEKNRILTCAHVVRDAFGKQAAGGFQNGSITGWIAGGQGTDCFTARVLEWFPSHDGRDATDDFALLETDYDGLPLPLRSASECAGEAFETFGFPGGFSNTGRSAKGTVGWAAKPYRAELLGENEITEHQVAKGFSGAPVIVGKHAVGVVVSVSTVRTTIGYMVPIEYIAEKIRSLGSRVAPRFDVDYSHVQVLRDELSSLRAKHNTDERFDLRLRYSKTFEGLTNLVYDSDATSYGETDLPPRGLFSPEIKRSPVLICAPGGSGKTSFLIRVVDAAIAYDVVPFFLSFARSSDSQIPEADEPFFDQFTLAGGHTIFEKAIVDSKLRGVVVIADGLNERDGSQARTLLTRIERLNRKHASKKLLIVVADRFYDRGKAAEGFDLASIVPLINDTTSTATSGLARDRLRQLLSSPFFLDIFRVEGDSAKGRSTSRAATIENYLKSRCSMADDELRNLSKAAYQAFVEGKGPYLGEQRWRSLAEQFFPGSDLLGRLRDHGVLIATKQENSGKLGFRHQLIHDFLLSRYVVELEPTLWRAPIFDAVSLNTASFDALELVAEQLTTKSKDFLAEVYDWNYLAVVDSIRSLETKGSLAGSPVPKGFGEAVYVLNAERLFDRFVHTADKMDKRRSELQSKLPFLANVKSGPELWEHVRNSDVAKDGREMDGWRELYLRTASPQVEDIELLWRDPFTGWTAANVFRRWQPSQEIVARLIMIYGALLGAGESYPRAVGARWRIAHMLGAADTSYAGDFLERVAFTSAKDSEKLYGKAEDKWVRYGAARSLVEGLSRPEGERLEFRNGKLQALAARVSEIDQINVIQELGRLRAIRPDENGWASAYEVVYNACLKAEASLADPAGSGG